MKYVPVIMAILVILVSITPAAVVTAERDTIDTIWGFDRTDGGVESHSSEHSDSPHIKFDSGIATLDLKRFYSISLSFNIHSRHKNSDTGMEVRIIDSEDEGNYVQVEVIPVNSEESRITTVDYYDNEEKDEWTTKRAIDIYRDWRTVRITIERTGSDLDGTKKQISTKIRDKTFQDDEEIYSTELSADVTERMWDRIEFQSEEPGKVMYIDHIILVTEGPDNEKYGGLLAFNINMTFIAVSVGLVVVVVAVIKFDLCPWCKKNGRRVS